jgi:hypothetical protein
MIMGVHYIETFNIPGVQQLGIEDYEDGRSMECHFMPEKAKMRYNLWCGGCGIGATNTIEDARKKLHRYAQVELEKKRRDLVSQLGVVSKSAGLLAGNDSFVLGTFKVSP